VKKGYNGGPAMKALHTGGTCSLENARLSSYVEKEESNLMNSASISLDWGTKVVGFLKKFSGLFLEDDRSEMELYYLRWKMHNVAIDVIRAHTRKHNQSMGDVEVRTPIKDKKVKMGGVPAVNEMYTPMQSPVIPFGLPGQSFVYAIRKGRNGIKNEVVNTWAECAVLVKDGFGMQYRKFPLGTEHEVIERYFKSGKDDRDEAARVVLERNQYRPKSRQNRAHIMVEQPRRNSHRPVDSG
jgi:hypothetical protein